MGNVFSIESTATRPKGGWVSELILNVSLPKDNNWKSWFDDFSYKDFGLIDALNDLNEVIEEAREEGFLIPSEVTIRTAERLVREIYKVCHMSFGVYPMPDGEIAIDIYDGKGSSVILLCESTGGSRCMVNINGEGRYAHYPKSKINKLPDEFIKKALDELKT